MLPADIQLRAEQIVSFSFFSTMEDTEEEWEQRKWIAEARNVAEKFGYGIELLTWIRRLRERRGEIIQRYQCT
jgi:hypothetical protein